MTHDGTTFDAIRRIDAIFHQLDLGEFDVEKGEQHELWREVSDLERVR